MQLENLNIYSFILFLTIIGIVFFLVMKFFYKHSSFKDNYFYNLKYIFLILSFLILSFSIFSPNWYTDITKQSKSANIVFTLDVSKSMNVEDIIYDNRYVDRLNFSKSVIWDYVISNPENNYSLVIFSGESVISMPFTNDINLFLTVLDWVDYRNLTVQWSNFEDALLTSIDRFEFTENKSWAIIFLSDWWDIDYEVNNKILEKIKSEKINYLFWAIWTEDWWKITLWQDVFWRKEYQTYNWNYVISKLNENSLKQISDYLGGEYLKVSNLSDLDNFEKVIDKLEKSVMESSFNQKTDLSRNLWIISFILFLLYLFLYLFDKQVYLLITKNEKA